MLTIMESTKERKFSLLSAYVTIKPVEQAT